MAGADAILKHQEKQEPATASVVFNIQAHPAPIVSIQPLTAPPGLITMDSLHNVRMMSPTGELYASFNMATGLSVESTAVPKKKYRDEEARDIINGHSCVWPPPHVLSAQLRLAHYSKLVCKALNMRDRSLRKRIQAVGRIIGLTGGNKKAFVTQSKAEIAAEEKQAKDAVDKTMVHIFLLY